MFYREDGLIDNTPEELNLNPIPYETRPQTSNSLKIPKSTSLSHFLLSFLGLKLPIFIFFALYTLPIFELYPTEHTSFAIVITVLFVWCFDTSLNLNSYIVSYIIPIFAVWLQIGIDKEKGIRIPATDLASNFTFIFMSPEVLTILGSLTLILAIDKYNINRYFFSMITSIIQPYPRIILFSIMLMNFILGLFSPVFSTTFFLSLSLSIIRSIDPNDNFSKALLLGIAWSGNCSSIASIYSSITLPISKFEYFIYAIGSSIILCLIECFFLIKVFKVRKRKFVFLRAATDNFGAKSEVSENFNLNESDENFSEEKTAQKLKRRDQNMQKSQSANNLRSSHNFYGFHFGNSMKYDHLNFNQYLVIMIASIIFILLTYSNSFNFSGHEGITSLLSIVLFFGFGLLTTNEFNNLSWSTIALAGGGLALSEVMKLSGLFDFLMRTIFERIDHFTGINHSIQLFHKGLNRPFNDWLTTVLYLASFSVFASIFTDKNLLVDRITAAWNGSPVVLSVVLLVVNVAQMLPVSSFSNLIVMSVVNEETNEPILSGSIFVKYGIVSELIAVAVFATIGFYMAHSLDI